MNELCHTLRTTEEVAHTGDVTHSYVRREYFIWKMHVTLVNGASQVYERVMSHVENDERGSSYG